ncbi:YihY/virulence factor BrkB family protein [Clostridium culturomicium]|uniref:YihY/virulence factor BrkB family protein n=1 Tax=Clostridium culturomicium TaxID=1499683 RepID=UPI00058C71A5|nr:YihY/virulence factor BrkB family protein [Clostridium culturomicium]
MKIPEYSVKMVIRYNNHHISNLSSQLAFDIMFSMVPFLILLLSLVGFINVNPASVLESFRTMIPEQLYELVSTLTMQLLLTRNGNLLSVSLIFSLYTASRAFRAIRYGLNRAYNEEEDKNFIKVIFFSIIFMFVIIMLILFTLAVLVFGEKIGSALIKWLDLSPMIFNYVNYLRYPIGIVGMVVVFTVIYKLIPSRRVKIMDALPGAVFTSVVWTVSSMGFAYYVNNFGRYSDLYGSIGVIIILMIWLKLTSTTILLGGELNAIIMQENEYVFK